MCDAIIANGGVKKRQKKVQNVCDGGAIKHGSDFSCVCDAGHLVNPFELFAIGRTTKMAAISMCVRYTAYGSLGQTVFD